MMNNLSNYGLVFLGLDCALIICLIGEILTRNREKFKIIVFALLLTISAINTILTGTIKPIITFPENAICNESILVLDHAPAKEYEVEWLGQDNNHFCRHEDKYYLLKGHIDNGPRTTELEILDQIYDDPIGWQNMSSMKFNNNSRKTFTDEKGNFAKGFCYPSEIKQPVRILVNPLSVWGMKGDSCILKVEGSLMETPTPTPSITPKPVATPTPQSVNLPAPSVVFCAHTATLSKCYENRFECTQVNGMDATTCTKITDLDLRAEGYRRVDGWKAPIWIKKVQ